MGEPADSVPVAPNAAKKGTKKKGKKHQGPSTTEVGQGSVVV